MQTGGDRDWRWASPKPKGQTRTYSQADDVGILPGRTPSLITYLPHGELDGRSDDIVEIKRRREESRWTRRRRKIDDLFESIEGGKEKKVLHDALVSSRNVRTGTPINASGEVAG